MSTVSIAVGSLILGKAVLIMDMLPAINRYPDKPLAYNVVWKTVMYMLVASIIHFWNALSISLGMQAASSPATSRCSRKWCGHISGR